MKRKHSSDFSDVPNLGDKSTRGKLGSYQYFFMQLKNFLNVDIKIELTFST